MPLWLLASPLTAELITVGPLASGCDFDNLVFAGARAAITPEADTIAIADHILYSSSVALVLSNEANVTMIGVTGCSNLNPLRRFVIATRGDLISFISTNLTIRSLVLQSDPGGGRLLKISGSMLLTLENARISGGKADDGANIHISKGASMVALDQAQISQGDATFNGGGIYCSGSGTVALTQGSRVADNTAGENGGGIYATGCAVNVLSGGSASAGALYGVVDNVAENAGGGIYGRSGADIIVAGTSARPATVEGNHADFHGGGIYLTGASSIAAIHDAEIINDRSYRRGGGLFVGGGATLEMDRTLATCPRGVRCSLLAANTSGGLTGVAAHGGAITVDGGGRAEIRQTYVTGNGPSTSPVAEIDGSDSFLLIEGSTLYANDPSGTHIFAHNNGHARLAYVSAWGSSSPGVGMFFAGVQFNGRVDLVSSVVIEGNGTSPAIGGQDRVFAPLAGGGTYFTDCVIAHEGNSVPDVNGTNSVVSDPAAMWAAPSSGDPHLSASSSAFDYCDAGVYAPVDRDIDNEDRGFDTPRPNFLGPFDLGADELIPPPSSPLIFMDGFESGDTSAWSRIVA